ncbi:ceramide kinase isoform X2 [Microcaecilia unicolor]|uniref:Ceramide kinase isoform X2 n=1 Tax=Microcaecilia unicolor TaxID=1415580 RepID=A0A6P7ZA19_9AMPH|nr:ceramide kinase isoform X2 [Microcaecilia unicolor]
MESARRPLVSQLWVKNRRNEAVLDPERPALSWKELQPKSGRVCHSVPISEIIAVETEQKRYNSDTWQKFNHHAFTVHYAQRAQKHCWRCSAVTFWCKDEELCHQWIQAIKKLLELQTSRPKHLLVYINPYGGKQQGKQIYEQKVAPLFSLASITTDVIVTERANHAKDDLFEVNLEKYDGVISVGGDGMFSEVMHGLIGRMQKDSSIDQNNPSAPLAPCNLRIGIIPAGSTDCICYATVGINDPVTSALHIIIGDLQHMDVCSVHHNNTFLKYSVSLLGYGFYGDVLKDSEKNRWMGPTRYDFSGFKTFLSHHYYEGTVSFQQANQTLGSPRDKSTCQSGCYICKQSTQEVEEKRKRHHYNLEETEDDGDWKVIRGKFMAINAANMSCACPRSPKGLSPAAHLAAGTIDLILVRRCSRLNFLRHLVRHKNQDDQFDLAFVEVYRVKTFLFTPKHSENEDTDNKDVRKKHFNQICNGNHSSCGCNHVNSIWNCDGEALDHAAVEVRVHCQLIKLFARGIEEDSKP